MVFNRVLVVLFSFFTGLVIAQKRDSLIEPPIKIPIKSTVILCDRLPKVSRPKKEINVWPMFETMAIFPGCEKEKTRTFKDKCSKKSIYLHVDKHFNMDLVNQLGLDSGRYRIMVQFKVNRNGNITNIQAKAPHAKLKKEAIGVIKKLPKIGPATDRGNPITVKYALPINFIVD